MDLFESNVYETIKQNNMISRGDKIVAGLSGGADSCAMLFALHKISHIIGFKLCAAHLEHGIRGKEALRDLEFSKEFAKNLGIEFVSKSVSVPQYCKQNKMSEEMAGRKLRYEFFNEICTIKGFNKIAVAHNLNDRAETVLINLARGSGSDGLIGIRPVNGNIIRPLINTLREDIESYALRNKINYVTDSTNKESIYIRNIVRNDILPALMRINEKAVNNIVRCSSIIACEADFTDSFVHSLNAMDSDENSVKINRKIFDAQHLAIKRKLIFAAVKMLNGNTVNMSLINADSVINAVKTGNIISLSKDTSVIIEHDSLVFTNDTLKPENYEYIIKIPGKITVSETGFTYNFEIVTDMQKNDSRTMYLNYDKLSDCKTITLRCKADGDTFQPYGMNGSKKIKKFYIDNKIPRQKRNMYPLLDADGSIAAVVPLRADRNYIIDDTVKKILKITISGGANGRK